MSTRTLERTLRATRAEGRPAFVPFLVVGDPNPDGFLMLADALVQAGADVLELGFPFSDPPADGPVIQAADQRALAAGVSTSRALELCQEVHRRHPQVALSLLVYFNLVLQRGIPRFYRDAAQAGVDAVLVADVPMELADPLWTAAGDSGVAPVCLASAATDAARAAVLAPRAEGYVYAAARVGVTGARSDIEDDQLASLVRRLRSAGVEVPILAGFGISTPEHIQKVAAAGADGAIVGSALVAAAAACLPDTARAAAVLGERARTLRAACNPN